jgi:hypothetical protein
VQKFLFIINLNQHGKKFVNISKEKIISAWMGTVMVTGCCCLRKVKCTAHLIQVIKMMMLGFILPSGHLSKLILFFSSGGQKGCDLGKSLV